MRRALLSAMLIAGLGSCGGSEPTGPPVAASISLSETHLRFTSLLETQSLSATVLDQKGAAMSGAELLWSSSDTAVASVSTSGQVTSRAIGSAVVTVTSGAAMNHAAIDVVQLATSGTVDGPRTTLSFIGDTTKLQASYTDAQGQPVFAPTVSWSSSAPAVVSVVGGIVRAEASGTATISASFEGVTASLDVSVVQVAAAVSLSPDPVLLSGAGSSGTVVAEVRDAGGAPIADPDLVWTSTDPSIAEVDVAGHVTAVADGTAAVSASVEGASGTITDEVRVTVNGPPELLTTELPNGLTGRPYSVPLSVGGGGGSSYGWSISAGSLPAGLTLGADGSISGTPTTVESALFTVTVTGQNGLESSYELTLAVYDPLVIVPPAWPTGVVGRPYSQTLQATGGDGTYTWSLASGTPPPGLGFSDTGTLSGEPTAAGSTTFRVQVVTGDGQSGTRQLTIAVYLPLTVEEGAMPIAWTGEPYDQPIGAKGGYGSGTWSLTGGTLPQGLSLSSNGHVTGLAVEPDTTSFTVQVQTGDGQVASGEMSIVALEPLTFQRSYLPGGYLDTPYTASMEPAGGATGAYTYTVVAGTLPWGLTLDPATGSIAGTPTLAGMYFFAVRVESATAKVTSLFSITISTNPPSGFNLWGALVGGWIPTQEQITQINLALARWEAIVQDELQDFTLPPAYAGVCDRDDDLSALLSDAYIDDVLVLMDFEYISEPGVLGYAYPCLVESGAPRTILGRVTLDIGGLERLPAVQVFETTWHELGHVMGIGSLWEYAGLVTGSGTPAATYVGSGANGAYTALGGTGSAPIELDGGDGTAFFHWDEGRLDTEIMTGWAESGLARNEVISSITIAGLADIGWTVDAQQAETFVLPACSPNCDLAPVSGPARAPAGGVIELPPPRPPIALPRRP